MENSSMAISDQVESVLREVAKAARLLRSEPGPDEQLALAKVAHEALSGTIQSLEREATAKRWAGRRIRSLTRAEKVQMVQDLGVREFERRLVLEY
jgi:hypothetical protein